VRADHIFQFCRAAPSLVIQSVEKAVFLVTAVSFIAPKLHLEGEQNAERYDKELDCTSHPVASGQRPMNSSRS
jgi:hypothetical protein